MVQTLTKKKTQNTKNHVNVKNNIYEIFDNTKLRVAYMLRCLAR